MKIICIGRNYTEHIKELNNETPEKPVIFLKPSTAILREGQDFYYPEFSKDIHYECEIILKIGKNGKHIKPKFALDYISEISVGIDFTARDLQTELKNKGLPWELAKAFDQSAVIGRFIGFEAKTHRFSLTKNKETVQEGQTDWMLHSFTDIIVFVSQFFTLQTGDIIFTGTPKGVAPIAIGDFYQGFLNGEKLLEVQIK
jgi:acylpyruvate hydrolase